LRFKLIGSVVTGIVIAVIGAMYASSLTENPNYNQYILFGLNGLVLLGVSMVPFVIKNHTASYLKAHGKGLAKIEQIEDLTRLVEEVKQEFHDESLALKAKLDVKSGVATSLKDEERLAVINLNSNLYDWFHRLTGSIYSDSIKEVEERELNIDDLYIKLGNSEATFKLFVEDNDVMTKYLNLKSDILAAFAQQRISATTEIKLKLNRIIQPAITQVHLTNNRQLREKMIKETHDYGDFAMEKHKDLSIQLNEFQTSCRTLLYKI